MENLIFAFQCIAPLFITIALGYYLKEKKVIGTVFMNTASEFSFQYLFPLVMFRQIYRINLREDFNPIFILYGIIAYMIFGFLLGVIVPRYLKKDSICGAFLQGVYRSNCLLMGVALATNVFGPEGSLPTVLLLPFISMVQNAGAVIFLTIHHPERKKQSVKAFIINIFKNPIILGAAAGLLCSLLQIELPKYIQTSIDDLAGMATTLALIALGGQIEFKMLFGNVKLVIVGCFLKLFVTPLCMLLPAAMFFSFSNFEIGAYYFIFGSCTAVSSFVMAKSMKADEVLASQLIIFTTIASALSMLLWISGLNMLHMLT